MSYKYNNVVIKPGLYLGDQGGLNGDTGASSPIFSSMQLSLATNGLSRRDDNFFVLPGYKAILYKNTDISYITVYTIDNTTGADIKGVWNDVYNTAGANQISKVDLFYNNVKIDYSNIKTMGFKASARLCWGAKLGEHSDGSYNKYALVLESSTPKINSGGRTNETNGIVGINRPYVSLPWIQPISATKASHSFWWCSKGYESGVGNADISYALGLYPSSTYSRSTIINIISDTALVTEIFFENSATSLTFFISGSKYKSNKNVCDGLWHHIVWNINGTTWDIYTDGVLETTTGQTSYSTAIVNTGSSQFGIRSNYTTNDTATNGYIADFRFYKNVLSPTEINGLLNGDHTYKTSLDVSSCLFQYTFDPSAVYTNNYTTYAIGAATVPYAAELRNGADILMPSMDLTDSLGKNIKILPFTIGSNGFSISFWWRSDGLWDTQGENSRLFYLGNEDESTNINFLLRRGSNKYPGIKVESNKTVSLPTFTSLCDDTWKHIVLTIKSDGTWILYVNTGQVYRAFSVLSPIYPDVIQRSTNYIGSGYLTTDGYPCGFIGDFRMYNATLSSDNVTSLYNRTNTTDNEINLIQHYDFVEETMNANNNILYSNAPRYALELTNNTTTTGASGQYATTAAIATGTNGLTFSFWWKSKGDYSNQGGWSRIFDFGNGGGDERIVFAIKYGSDTYPAIEVKRSTNAALSVPLPALTGLCDERWKHVVWTMTNSTTQTSTWNIYINNVLRYTGTAGWYPNNITRTNHYIGRSYSLDGCPNGFIADFRVYDEVFTTQKITDLYNEVYTSETNLLLHTLYPTKTAPTLVNGAKIPITSSKTQIIPYNSLYLDGTATKWAEASLTAGLITNAGVSFAFWFKPTGTQGSYARIFDFGNSTQSDNIIFGRYSTNNYPMLQIYNGVGQASSTTATLTDESDFFSNQVWKHAVWTMTYSTEATSTWNVYINGKQYGSTTLTTAGAYPTSLIRTSCFIGKSNWTLDGLLNGQVADFRVYNSVLTQANVTALYNGIYTDNTSLFLQYPIDKAGTTNPSTITFTLQSSATIQQPTMLLATDPSLNYHRGSYLSLPPLVKPGTNGLSFSIWWRAGATYANQGSFSRLFSFSNGKNRDTIEFILNTSTLGYPTIQVYNGIKFGDNGITTMTSLCDGTWKHIVWTMTYCAPTQNTSTWILYVNGTALSTITATGTYPKDVSRKYAYIGQSAWIQNSYPTGDFADFRVYGAVLTQANVNSLYALSDTTDNEDKLLLRQKFDSTESYLYQTCDNIKPSVLFENDPAITNTPTGQHVVLPALPGLLSTDVPDRRGISISFWWKSKGLSGISGMLFETGFAQDNDVLFLRTREGLNTYMSAQYYYGTGPADVNIQFGTADGDIENLENGEWHHIVWTMSYEGNGKNSYWKYYMDGYFIKTTGLIANAYIDPLNAFATKQINNFIGRSNWATINGCLNGYMSDFRIYNKCLTTQDVGDLYTNTYDDNSDLFLRYSFEKKIQIDNSEYTNIKAENDPSIIILLNGGATVVDNASDGPSNFSSYLKLSGTTIQWARPYLPKSFSLTSQTGLSFSFWFKPTGTSTTTARIFDFGNGQQNDNVLIWRNLASSMYPTFYVTSGTSNTNDFSVALSDWSTFFSTQNWKHVVWTLTSGTGGLTSTWNAYLDKSRYGSADLTTVGRYPTDIVRTSNLIGKSNWPGDTGILFGNITGFRIYTTVLTQANVNALYDNTFTDKSNLFFSTDFKPKYNINLTPSHSTDTTQVARLYNGATLSTDTYKFGTSSLFLSNMTTTTNPAASAGQGYTQYMSLIAPLPKLGTNGISFSFWWKSAGAQGTSPALFDFCEGPTDNRITFWIGNSPSVETRSSTNTVVSYTLTQTNFNDTNWHHIVWNIDKYNNTWELFYDNVSSDTITGKAYPENVSRPYCFLGRTPVSGDGGANGYIDEFRIYSKALTATDVDNLYNNIDTTSTSLTDKLIVYYSFNQDASKKVMDEQYIDNNVLDTPIFNT